MSNVESGLKSEIGKIFGVKEAEIGELENLEGSNLVYSFTLEKQKYVIHKLNDTSIMNWEWKQLDNKHPGAESALLTKV